MIMRLKNIAMLTFLGAVAWVGWIGYFYFFDIKTPAITISGLENKKSYAGEVQCIVSSDKTGHISIWLDDQPLINNFKMGAHNEGHPFIIPTKTISNGSHLLKAEFTDTTFNQNKSIAQYVFEVDNVPLQAAFVKSDSEFKVLQGRTLHLQFQVNKPIEKAQVRALADSYNCFPESKDSLIYECFIPIECEEKPSEYLLSVDIADKVGNALRLDNKFQVVMYPFKKQYLRINKDSANNEEDLTVSAKQLEEEIEKITKNSPLEKLWRGAFCTPIDVVQVTTPFGTVRTTQEKGRYSHKALDIINTPKSVVWAPQDGVVVLKESYANSGNTVIVDHGCGVISMFFHLDDFANINVGDKIAKGNPVGTLGKTGYAKGYHLHWEMRVNNVAIDPMQWTKTTF